MREIRFRAWINKLDGWADDCMVNGEGGFVAYYNGIAYYNAELEQFTGLRDKNGREIYEGDILERYSAMVPKGSNPIIRQVVVWAEYKWAGINAWGACEVIGNIHENPELLA